MGLGTFEEALYHHESVDSGLFLRRPRDVERSKEGPGMKPLKLTGCLLLVPLLAGLFAGQAVAERPKTIEIRDKMMWGDPDEPAGSRRVGELPRAAIESGDRETIQPRSLPQCGRPQSVKTVWVTMTWLGFEVGLQQSREYRGRTIRISAPKARR